MSSGSAKARRKGSCSRSAAIDDTPILERAVCNQDRDAAAILYAKYSVSIKHYIASHIGRVPDVEDLAEEVSVQLCKGTPDYDGRGNVEAYLHGIARNLIRRYLRRQAHTIRTVPIDLIKQRDVLSKTEPHRGELGVPSGREFKKMLQDLKALMPPKAYEAVELRLVKGLSAKQAAEKLGCSVDAFRKRLQRAARTLQCKIREKSD
jgi:RNA polymerase sigma-70 factor (ECF subfamily)